MPHNNIINQDAIFIADAHYNSTRDELYEILNDIKSKKICTSQIFLMGDMFDFLSNEIIYFKIQNKIIIKLINELSNDIQIIYFEGNHDFNLKEIFKNIQVIKRENQNRIFEFNNQKISLAHGDIFTPISYNIYSKIIRNKYFMKFINLIDIDYIISKKVDKWLLQKNIYHKFEDFNTFAQKRIKSYKDNYKFIIEGHFHQGNRYKNYINLASLSENKTYLKIIDNEFYFVKN
jgi:UDP-2,3-diacylglucosamine hydrolase